MRALSGTLVALPLPRPTPITTASIILSISFGFVLFTLKNSLFSLKRRFILKYIRYKPLNILHVVDFYLTEAMLRKNFLQSQSHKNKIM